MARVVLFSLYLAAWNLDLEEAHLTCSIWLWPVDCVASLMCWEENRCKSCHAPREDRVQYGRGHAGSHHSHWHLKNSPLTDNEIHCWERSGPGQIQDMHKAVREDSLTTSSLLNPSSATHSRDVGKAPSLMI